MLVSTGDSTSCPDGARREGGAGFWTVTVCVQRAGCVPCAWCNAGFQQIDAICFCFLGPGCAANTRRFLQIEKKGGKKHRTRNPRGKMPEVGETYGMNRSRARAPSLGRADAGQWTVFAAPGTSGLGGEMVEERTRRVVGSLGLASMNRWGQARVHGWASRKKKITIGGPNLASDRRSVALLRSQFGPPARVVMMRGQPASTVDGDVLGKKKGECLLRFGNDVDWPAVAGSVAVRLNLSTIHCRYSGFYHQTDCPGVDGRQTLTSSTTSTHSTTTTMIAVPGSIHLPPRDSRSLLSSRTSQPWLLSLLYVVQPCIQAFTLRRCIQPPSSPSVSLLAVAIFRTVDGPEAGHPPSASH